MCVQAETENTTVAVDASQDAPLIAQLRRVHQELLSMLALAAEAPPGEQYDAAVRLLQGEINALGQEFLRLSEELLARGDAEANLISN